MTEQQPEVTKHLKELDYQNSKLRKLLNTALDIADQDASSYIRLQKESKELAAEVLDLENEKQHLENVLSLVNKSEHFDNTVDKLEKEHSELRFKLEEVLTDIRRGNVEIEELKSEDVELKKTIRNLENKKKSLLEQIKIVEKRESVLSQLGTKLKEKVSEIEQTEARILIANKSNITKDDTLKRQPKFLKTVTGCKILTDNSKRKVYEELEETIIDSTDEINKIKNLISDANITKLINEIEIQKNILLDNIELLKNTEENNDRDNIDTSEVETNVMDLDHHSGLLLDQSSKSSLTVHNKFEYEEDPLLTVHNKYDDDEDPSLTVHNKYDDEEDPSLTVHNKYDDEEDSFNQQEDDLTTSTEQERLDELVARLENERAILLRRLNSLSETTAEQSEEIQPQTQSELHSSFMREVSSEHIVDAKKYDDATNQLYADEEARLEQRIRELEAENERIKTELDSLLSQIRGETEVKTTPIFSFQLKRKIEELELEELSKH